MTRSRYIVGIDLGTTNCAVAYVESGPRAALGRYPRFPGASARAPAETTPPTMLPSFL